MNSGFSKFWPDYLYAHHKRATRICHYIATLWGAVVGFYGIFTLQILFFLAGILGGYVIAVASHYLFEGRKPLVTRNPFWGACSDLRMLTLALTRRLKSEYEKHGIEMG